MTSLSINIGGLLALSIQRRSSSSALRSRDAIEIECPELESHSLVAKSFQPWSA